MLHWEGEGPAEGLSLSAPDVLETVPGERWDEERGLNERSYIVPGAGGLGEARGGGRWAAAAAAAIPDCYVNNVPSPAHRSKPHWAARWARSSLSSSATSLTR